jgi:citrate lyase gamma subunit
MNSSEEKIELQEICINNDNNYRPIGIFWDLETCRIPDGKSVKQLVKRIIDFVIVDQIIDKINVFYCFCDSIKLTKRIINQLNQSNVDILHVNSGRKQLGSKLRTTIEHFLYRYAINETKLVLITTDLSLMSVLRMAKTRGSEVTLIYGKNISNQLLTEDIVDNCIGFDSITDGLKSSYNSHFRRSFNRNNSLIDKRLSYYSKRKRFHKKIWRNRCYNSETIDSNDKPMTFTEQPKRLIDDQLIVCDQTVVNSCDNQSIVSEENSKCEDFTDFCCYFCNCIVS